MNFSPTCALITATVYTLRAVHAVQLRIIQGPSGMDGGGGEEMGRA